MSNVCFQLWQSTWSRATSRRWNRKTMLLITNKPFFLAHENNLIQSPAKQQSQQANKAIRNSPLYAKPQAVNLIFSFVGNTSAIFFFSNHRIIHRLILLIHHWILHLFVHPPIKVTIDGIRVNHAHSRRTVSKHISIIDKWHMVSNLSLRNVHSVIMRANILARWRNI